MKAAGMEVRNIFWLLTGTPWSSSCISWTSCSSLSKTAGRWEMPLEVPAAPAPPEGAPAPPTLAVAPAEDHDEAPGMATDEGCCCCCWERA